MKTLVELVNEGQGEYKIQVLSYTIQLLSVTVRPTYLNLMWALALRPRVTTGMPIIVE